MRNIILMTIISLGILVGMGSCDRSKSSSEITMLRAQVSDLEAKVEELETQVSDLDSEKDAQAERISELEDAMGTVFDRLHL